MICDLHHRSFVKWSILLVGALALLGCRSKLGVSGVDQQSPASSTEPATNSIGISGGTTAGTLIVTLHCYEDNPLRVFCAGESLDYKEVIQPKRKWI